MEGDDRNTSRTCSEQQHCGPSSSITGIVYHAPASAHIIPALVECCVFVNCITQYALYNMLEQRPRTQQRPAQESSLASAHREYAMKSPHHLMLSPQYPPSHRNLLASRSDSSRHRISSSRTVPRNHPSACSPPGAQATVSGDVITNLVPSHS